MSVSQPSEGADARELKKGSADLLILSLVEERARHGYEIAKLIETRSKGSVTFHAASLYPLLYRLERRGWIAGRWQERPGARRRRLYAITREGRKVLAARRSGWRRFVKAIEAIAGAEYA
jgi:PadR family transcriptional regulator